jgi:hypothetical protein
MTPIHREFPRKLGAVVISRNDGYGGDQPLKALYSLTSMIEAMDEVVYVDWNSPNDVSQEECVTPPAHGQAAHIRSRRDAQGTGEDYTLDA